MKALKQWFIKIKIIILNILGGIINLGEDIYIDYKTKQLDIEKEKLELKKECLYVVKGGVKHFYDNTRGDFKEICKECKHIFSKPKNRIICGLIIVSIGGGLIISGYIPMPN
ncbi:MAG: hypothetical protein ACI4XM_01260 [Candidatus Coprovivens sp.]